MSFEGHAGYHASRAKVAIPHKLICCIGFIIEQVG